MSDPSIPPGVPSELRGEARAAVTAALAGGRAAMQFYGGDLEVTLKQAGDPVTRADLLRPTTRFLKRYTAHFRTIPS